MEQQFTDTQLYKSLVILIKQGNYITGRMTGSGSEQLEGSLKEQLCDINRAVCRTSTATDAVQSVQFAATARRQLRTFCLQLEVCCDSGFMHSGHCEYLTELACEVEKQLSI